jgi:hypothetical protein
MLPRQTLKEGWNASFVLQARSGKGNSDGHLKIEKQVPRGFVARGAAAVTAKDSKRRRGINTKNQ